MIKAKEEIVTEESIRPTSLSGSEVNDFHIPTELVDISQKDSTLKYETKEEVSSTLYSSNPTDSVRIVVSTTARELPEVRNKVSGQHYISEIAAEEIYQGEKLSTFENKVSTIADEQFSSSHSDTPSPISMSRFTTLGDFTTTYKSIEEISAVSEKHDLGSKSTQASPLNLAITVLKPSDPVINSTNKLGLSCAKLSTG